MGMDRKIGLSSDGDMIMDHWESLARLKVVHLLSLSITKIQSVNADILIVRNNKK